MESIARRRFTAKQKTELWERWRQGQCVADIARALQRRNKSGVYRVLALNGGMRPSSRRRSAMALTLEEREEISRGIAVGTSIRAIAAKLGRAASTVSREVNRNGGRRAYRASDADRSAWERAHRPKPCRLATHSALRWVVAQKLALEWSPEQREHLSQPVVQTRGVLRKELIAHLRTGRNIRRPRGGTTKIGLGSLVDAVSIRERPAEAQDRAVPGHWEGDLLCGADNSYIATLVERQTRFPMLIKIPDRGSATVVGALSRQVRKLPQELRRSLTWDRGKEMADHKKFTVATDVQVYFCDPRSPWQRGSNENTNGLLRQYFPRGTDLSVYSQAHLNRVALRLNQRPERPWASRRPPIDYERCSTD